MDCSVLCPAAVPRCKLLIFLCKCKCLCFFFIDFHLQHNSMGFRLSHFWFSQLMCRKQCRCQHSSFKLYICLSSPYLSDDRPSVFPIMEAAAGQSINTLHLAQLPGSHLLVQKPLKSQVLVLIVYIIRNLHLWEWSGGKSLQVIKNGDELKNLWFKDITVFILVLLLLSW